MPWPRTSPISRHGPLAATGPRRHWPAAEATLFEGSWPSSVESGETRGPAEAWDARNVADSLREDRLLHSEGPHARALVRWRLSSWTPCPGGVGSRAIRLPCPAAGAAAGGSVVGSSHHRTRRAVTRDVLHRLLATCTSDCLADTHDVAILICRVSVRRTAWRRGCVSSSFAKGRLCTSVKPSSAESRRDVGALEPFPTPRPPARPETPCPPHRLPPSWCGQLDRKARRSGRCSGAIERRGAVADRALTPRSINLIVKRRCAMAGLDPRDYSTHRLRAGYSPKRRVEGLQ